MKANNNRGIAPLMLNLRSRWNMVNFIGLIPEKLFLYSSIKRLTGPQVQSERVEKRKGFLLLPILELQTVQSVA
jgi:hypothetical protein